MTKIKYVVIGGRVISKTDGNEHYISPVQLVSLYGVNRRECLLYSDAKDHYLKTGNRTKDELIYLFPRYDGNYDLTQKEEK